MHLYGFFVYSCHLKKSFLVSLQDAQSAINDLNGMSYTNSKYFSFKNVQCFWVVWFWIWLAWCLIHLILFIGQWLGSRQIRCNWATKGASNGEQQTSDSKNVADLTNNLTGNLYGYVTYLC